MAEECEKCVKRLDGEASSALTRVRQRAQVAKIKKIILAIKPCISSGNISSLLA